MAAGDVTTKEAVILIDGGFHEKPRTLRLAYDSHEPEAPERRLVTRGYYYVTNPATGLPAVFVDGETIPEWARPEDLPPDNGGTFG